MDKEIISEVIKDKTMLDKIISEGLLKLEEALPNIAIRLVSVILLVLVWPKIIKVILYTVEKTGKLRKANPLLISFLKSLIKTVLYVVLFFLL